ncbi:MAG: LexA repressor [Gemmatimonadetes bacterium]|nr:LexA repressor [Gemmatimonadota bacterium]
MTEPLTPLERRVYHYLIDFLAENTYQPSIREIAKKFRIKSTKTVSDLLGALSQKGFIQRDQSRSRGVRIVGHSGQPSTQPVPLYGGVRAGETSLHADDRTGHITVDRRFLPSDDVFFLRIKGDSMVGRGIHHDDYVMVSPSTRAKDGDIVAARIGDASAIRTMTHRGATIVLEAANESDGAIEVGQKDDFAVLGVVCGIFRPLHENTPQPMLPLSGDQPIS